MMACHRKADFLFRSTVQTNAAFPKNKTAAPFPERRLA
jgi:hypothetical protein